MKRLSPVFCLCLLVGCAPAPSAEMIARADYGAYPGDYQQIIDAYLAATLRDPDSAQYDHIKGPVKMWSSFLGSVKYGYGVCAFVNAKNGFGAYTGRRVNFYLINDGAIERQLGSGGDLDQELARSMCARQW